MAQTVQTNVANQIPTLWQEDLFAQAENLAFWHQFEGIPGSDAPIIRRDDLSKAAGDTIKIDLVLALTGAGVVGDTNLLAGNEERLTFNQMSVQVADWAHAVRWTEVANTLNIHDLRGTAAAQLAKRLAGKLDDDMWTVLTAASQPTINKYACGTATTIGTVADTDAAGRLKLQDISNIKAYAQSNLKIEPFRMENGEEYFGLVIDPYANLSLKSDSTFLQAERDAGIRGDTNRLFTGAAFLWDGVIGFVNNRVPTALDGVSSARVARNVFFGAQAASRAWAQYPDWVEEDFDYRRATGVATKIIKGDKLNMFDLSAAQDTSGNTAIGSMVVYSAAVAPTVP